jgi:hypothetical protein
MDGPCDQLFSGASLPEDEHGRVGRCNGFNLLLDTINCRPSTDDILWFVDTVAGRVWHASPFLVAAEMRDRTRARVIPEWDCTPLLLPIQCDEDPRGNSLNSLPQPLCSRRVRNLSDTWIYNPLMKSGCFSGVSSEPTAGKLNKTPRRNGIGGMGSLR